MNERVKKLAEEISKLPPEEQADLMDELLVLTYRAGSRDRQGLGEGGTRPLGRLAPR